MHKERVWLREIRESRNLTQEKIASNLGITRQHIGLIENGNATPSVETAKKIANVLGFNWTRFFEDDSTDENVQTN